LSGNSAYQKLTDNNQKNRSKFQNMGVENEVRNTKALTISLKRGEKIK
jgi:hypothetical protein